MESALCPVCHRKKPHYEIMTGHTIRGALVPFIKERKQDWDLTSSICLACLNIARCAFVEASLRTERGELSLSEQQVLAALENHDIITEDPSTAIFQEETFGDRLADKMASFGGSWSFLILFMSILTGWIFVNTYVLDEPFDPYPYILLNLLLSCIAATQAPIIMMSQNRTDIKDRHRSDMGYKTNLKAELEIRHLHIKMDQLVSQQWNRLLEIQQVQMELLRDLASKK